jgi:hypothetical protein
MPPHPQLTKLVATVLRRTDAGKTSWRSMSETSFSLSLEHGALTIESRDNDGLEPYEVKVWNEKGVVIDGYETEDRSSASDRRLLEELYESARRNALGVSDTIEALLNEVDDGYDDVPF